MSTICVRNHSTPSVQPNNFPRASNLARTAGKVGLFALKTIPKLILIGALATGVIAGTMAASAGGPLATFGACALLNFGATVITHKVIKYTQTEGNECPLLSAARKIFLFSTIISVGGVFGALCAGGAVGASSALTGGYVGASVTTVGLVLGSQHDQHGGS